MEEENCHFVYKHLWSPMKAPCSLAWVSPRRENGPGTQSVQQRRDFQAEGLEQWQVLLSAEGSVQRTRQWTCVPVREYHSQEKYLCCSRFCLWSANALRSVQSIYEALWRYQTLLSNKCGKSKRRSENMGARVFFIAQRKVCQSHHFERDITLSGPPPGEMSATIELCGILAFQRSYIPFY